MAFIAEYKHDVVMIQWEVGEFLARIQVVTQFVFK